MLNNRPKCKANIGINAKYLPQYHSTTLLYFHNRYDAKEQKPLDGGAPALDVVHDFGLECALLGKTHLGRVGRVRDPRSGSAGSCLLHHTIDLLEGKTLGLVDQDIGVNEAEGAERAPDEEDLSAKVGLIGADHIGGDNGDDAVPEPVGGGGETDTTGADGKREDLADDNPSAGAPGGGKEKDVDTDEGDHGAHGSRIVAVSDADNSNNELADDHSESTPDEKRAATEPLDSPEGDRRRAHVDEGGDQRDKEWVGNGTKILEE